MNDDKKRNATRRPYEKPMLRPIELAAEEVLAVGCKGPQLGMASGAVTPPCAIRNCARNGS